MILLPLYDIVIHTQSNQLCVVDVYQVEEDRCYPVATGKLGFSTPEGQFSVKETYKDPIYPGGDSELLGDYAVVTDMYTVGGLPLAIHGTDKEHLIGLYVSLGCIRMYNDDVTELVIEYLPFLRQGRIQK